jgi:hypothetical protein
MRRQGNDLDVVFSSPMIDVVCLSAFPGPQGLLLLEFRDLRFRAQDDQSQQGNQGRPADDAAANDAFDLGVLTQQADA